MSDYVTVEEAPNEAIGQIIRQRLEEAGIPCTLVPGNLAAVGSPSAACAVNVPADRADEARSLLSE